MLLRVASNKFAYHLLRVKCSELLRNMLHNMLSQMLRRVKAPYDITAAANPHSKIIQQFSHTTFKVMVSREGRERGVFGGCSNKVVRGRAVCTVCSTKL